MHAHALYQHDAHRIDIADYLELYPVCPCLLSVLSCAPHHPLRTIAGLKDLKSKLLKTASAGDRGGASSAGGLASLTQPHQAPAVAASAANSNKLRLLLLHELLNATPCSINRISEELGNAYNFSIPLTVCASPGSTAAASSSSSSSNSANPAAVRKGLASPASYRRGQQQQQQQHHHAPSSTVSAGAAFTPPHSKIRLPFSNQTVIHLTSPATLREAISQSLSCSSNPNCFMSDCAKQAFGWTAIRASHAASQMSAAKAASPFRSSHGSQGGGYALAQGGAAQAALSRRQIFPQQHFSPCVPPGSTDQPVNAADCDVSFFRKSYTFKSITDVLIFYGLEGSFKAQMSASQPSLYRMHQLPGPSSPGYLDKTSCVGVGGSFTYTPWDDGFVYAAAIGQQQQGAHHAHQSSMMMMGRSNVAAPASSATSSASPYASASSTKAARANPKLTVTSWEYLMVRLVGFCCHGAMSDKYPKGGGAIDDMPWNFSSIVHRGSSSPDDAAAAASGADDGPESGKRQISYSNCSQKVFSDVICHYLNHEDSSMSMFVARLVDLLVFSQYNLRPPGDYSWDYFQAEKSSRTQISGPLVPPPPVTLGDQGYVALSKWCKCIWTTKVSNVFQQGFYSTVLYVMSSKSITTKSLGLQTSQLRYLKINEWTNWAETWLDFYYQKVHNKGLQELLNHYHIVVDVLITVLTRATNIDPSFEKGLEIIEKFLDVASKLKCGHLSEAERVVDGHFSFAKSGFHENPTNANFAVNQGYERHLRLLNGYAPYFHHKLSLVPVTDNISELSWSVGRFSTWRGRVDAILKRGWGEGLISKGVSKGLGDSSSPNAAAGFRPRVKPTIERDKNGYLSEKGKRTMLKGLVKPDPEDVPFVGDWLTRDKSDWEIGWMVDFCIYLTLRLNRLLTNESEMNDRYKSAGGAGDDDYDGAGDNDGEVSEFERNHLRGRGGNESRKVVVNFRPMADSRNLFWGILTAYLFKFIILKFA